MKLSKKQEELYKAVLEKSKESEQKPLYVAVGLVSTNPEKFISLEPKEIIKVVREVEKFLAVEAMKNAAFGDDNHD